MSKRKLYHKEEYKGKEIRVYIDMKGFFHPNLRGRGISKRYAWSSDAVVAAKEVITRRKEK
jgi:hypothetical protein